MNKPYLQFTLEGELTDLDALFNAAKAHAVEHDGLPDAAAEEYCRDSDGEICPRRCLTMLLDPGSIPGFEIQHSTTD